ncbi:hypothetical protein [Phenylobacterium sp.]|uniref:hypothetical protein n=1 Tax=Phenylobacterium sp. TaxID=1871053 RepID=UPI002B850B53|nr:hypothetical protein [Phenylobacterium sp.]HLZ75042.1 hypothetical protein [Phenylobacterium sp.]
MKYRIRHLAKLAYHLDEWLQANLGRRYNTFLGFGLVLGLIHQFQDLPKDFAHGGGISTILVALMDVALLINQAGQFHEHLEKRRAMPRQASLLRRGRNGKAIAKTDGED